MLWLAPLALAALAPFAEDSFRQRLFDRWDTPAKLFEGVVAAAGAGFTAGVLASAGFYLLARSRGRSS